MPPPAFEPEHVASAAMAVFLARLRYHQGMPNVTMSPAVRADATELVRANRDSRSHYAPWGRPFTVQHGFDRWLGGPAEGTDLALFAGEERSGAVVGLTHQSQISRSGLQGAYLGFYGDTALARRGLMTAAVCLTVRHAFDAAGPHRIEVNVRLGSVRSLALACWPPSQSWPRHMPASWTHRAPDGTFRPPGTARVPVGT